MSRWDTVRQLMSRIPSAHQALLPTLLGMARWILFRERYSDEVMGSQVKRALVFHRWYRVTVEIIHLVYRLRVVYWYLWCSDSIVHTRTHTLHTRRHHLPSWEPPQKLTTVTLAEGFSRLEPTGMSGNTAVTEGTPGCQQQCHFGACGVSDITEKVVVCRGFWNGCFVIHWYCSAKIAWWNHVSFWGWRASQLSPSTSVSEIRPAYLLSVFKV